LGIVGEEAVRATPTVYQSMGDHSMGHIRNSVKNVQWFRGGLDRK